MRRSIKFFSLVAASALLGACGSSGTQVSSSSGGVTDLAIPVPEALVGEDRLLVPLSGDLDGLDQTGSEQTLGASESVLRLPSGATIEASLGEQTEPKKPLKVGTAELDGLPDREITEASWTTGQGTVVVQSTVPIREEFLQAYAMAVVSLPRSLAESEVDGKPIEPLSQTFRVGGLSFTRTLGRMITGSSQGLTQTLTVDIDDVDVSESILTNLSEFGGGLNPYPREELVFRTNDRYHWLVMAAGGLDLQVSGDDRADRITDELTGATYMLLTDENGDDKVELTTATQGGPQVSTFKPYIG